MYNILNFTIMFFQAINQMITAGTDLSINIRRVNNNLTVAVVPRRSGVKDGERIVPLILNGTPEELDAGFLQAVGHDAGPAGQYARQYDCNDLKHRTCSRLRG
jgi:hypothetical protein